VTPSWTFNGPRQAIATVNSATAIVPMRSLDLREGLIVCRDYISTHKRKTDLQTGRQHYDANQSRWYGSRYIFFSHLAERL